MTCLWGACSRAGCLWEPWGCLPRCLGRLYRCTTSWRALDQPLTDPAAMTTVPLAQARQQLSGLVDRVRAGEPVVISRHGKPVARLVFEPSADPTAQQWLERLRRLHHEASHGAV
jgi:prevent-host-death family protein